MKSFKRFLNEIALSNVSALKDAGPETSALASEYIDNTVGSTPPTVRPSWEGQSPKEPKDPGDAPKKQPDESDYAYQKRWQEWQRQKKAFDEYKARCPDLNCTSKDPNRRVYVYPNPPHPRAWSGNPPIGTKYVGPNGKIVEWDGQRWVDFD